MRDHLPAERRRVVEVEVLQAFGGREAGDPDALLAAVVLPGRYLSLETPGEDSSWLSSSLNGLAPPGEGTDAASDGA